MLELARYPPCVLPCHTLLEDPPRRNMSERKYSGSTRDASRSEHKDKASQGVREHRHGRSSAEDPSISSTHSNKHVSSNVRSHPRAELRSTDSSHQGGRQKHGSPVVNHMSSKSNGGRKRNFEDEDEEDVWVEHTSSSGRIYFYNKRNGVSQWERPRSMTKRPKTEDYQKHKSHSTSASSSSSSSAKHSSHSSSSSHSHSHSSSSKESAHRSHTSSHHTPHSSHYHSKSRERERGHSSHRHSNRASRSSSKSTSTSPTPAPRNRGHHDKTTPTRHSRSLPNKRSISPKPLCSTTAISPGTPSIPSSISQSLVATQQYIDHTSAIIKHQQKLFSASGDTSKSTQSPPSTRHTPHSSHSTHTPHASHSHAQPHARQRLVYGSGSSNGPTTQDSTGGSTPMTPVQNSGSAVTSPQLAGMESLHPLQRALLLQQQQQQQQAVQSDLPMGQTTPQTPLNSTPSLYPQAVQVVTPPISAIPSHLISQQSHPGSPFSDSPIPTPVATPTQMHLVSQGILGPYTPQVPPPQSQPAAFPYMLTPTPTPIPGIYMADQALAAGRGYVPTASPPKRPPMSRLGRREPNDELSKFPDPSKVESVVTSQASVELFSRSLAESWWGPATESLQRQLDNSAKEVLSHRTKEALYLQGRLRRAQLSLETFRIRTITRRERLLALEQLLGEIDQR